MKTILIDVLYDGTVYYGSGVPVTRIIESFTGIHRVDQLGGIVYKGFIHDEDLEDLKEALGWFAFRKCKYPDCIKVYVKEDMRRFSEEYFEYKKILKRRKWNGTEYVPTIGPV